MASRYFFLKLLSTAFLKTRRGSDNCGVRQVGQQSDIVNHLIIQLKWNACPQDNLLFFVEFVLETGSIQIEHI